MNVAQGARWPFTAMQQILEYVENEKHGAGDYGGRTQAQGNCSTNSKGADRLWRKRKEAGSGGGNICLADNRNEDVDSGRQQSDCKDYDQRMQYGHSAIMEVLNENPEADRESKNIAGDLVKAEEHFADELKAFL